MKDKLPKEAKELSLAYTLEMDTRFKKSWLQASKFHNLHKQEKTIRRNKKHLHLFA